MAKNGKLHLTLVDVHGEHLNDTVTIDVRHRFLNHRRRVSNRSARKSIVIDGLHEAPSGTYSVEVRPLSYLPSMHFVNVRSGAVTKKTMTFAIDPDRVGEVSFPKYRDLDDGMKQVLQRSDEVLEYEGEKGKKLYDAVDPVRRAGLLNIATKAFVTPFANGAGFLEHVTLIRLQGDRLYARVPKALHHEVEHSVSDGRFRPVGGSLHDSPVDGFEPAGSFKTPDRYGNLQMTFFAQGDERIVDVDIDDASGLGHVFQVVRNTLTGRPTHPYDIHQILVHHQQLDPGYRLLPQTD